MASSLDERQAALFRADGPERYRYWLARCVDGGLIWGLRDTEGWALVGDAGYHRDAVTGHGLSDAFRSDRAVGRQSLSLYFLRPIIATNVLLQMGCDPLRALRDRR